MKTMFTLMILLLFTVSLVAQPSERHIVVEELTGTWCQYCPRGAWYADSLMRKYENLIVRFIILQ